MDERIITMKMRLDYLYGIFKEMSGLEISFSEFMECLFSKLENEIRAKKSALEKYYEEGEGKKRPISDQTMKFIYDYEK